MRKRQIYSKLIVILLVSALLMGCGSDSDVVAQDNSKAEGSNAINAEETLKETEEVSETDVEANQGEETEAKPQDTQDASSDTDNKEDETTVVDEIKPWADGVPCAQEMVDSMTIGLSVGNSLDAFSGNNGVLHNDGLSTETVWGNPKVTKEYMDKVKGYGMDVIRIPVTWYNHVDPDTYEIDPAWLNRVHEVVDYAYDDETIVILNMHHDTGTEGWLKASDNDLDKKKEIYVALWAQIADSFKDYNYNLLFEGFNEMLDDNNEWSNPSARAVEIVNEYNQLFVDTVRSTDGKNPDRVLIVNSYCAGNGAKMLLKFNIPEDSASDRIIAEVHAYAPYQFTATEFPNVTTWSHGDVSDVLRFVNDTFKGKGVPVIIGEFGAVPKNNEDEILAYAEYYINHANVYGIKCLWWDNGIAREFALFDRNTGEAVKSELVETLINCAKQ